MTTKQREKLYTTEVYNDNCILADYAYRISYYPSYRDAVIRRVLKEVDYLKKPELTDAMRNYLLETIEQYPTLIVDEEELGNRVSYFADGYFACLEHNKT